ncbi:Retrovirus-related Pol polyprotein from transposon opus [Dictyocoela muelleri]|nr:Retrovirus-related Pol polyprotein from transposon opus [Dictyocoela muelleri]
MNSVEQEINNIVIRYSNNVITGKNITDEKFKIPTKNERILCSKPYRCPPYLQDLQKNEVEILLQSGSIRRSNSIFAEPCFIKEKGDEKSRLIIDYRCLNRISIPLQYYFPDIFDSFYKFSGSKIFSRIDLKRDFTRS